MMMFPRSTKEKEIMFILGIFIELVDSVAVAKKQELLIDTMKGVIENKLESKIIRAIPEFHFTMT